MGRSKSTKRIAMGEEAWLVHRRTKDRIKNLRYKIRNIEKVIEYRDNVKRQLIHYKGGKCERCGYNKDCPPAYKFHHINPKEKDFTISKRRLSFASAKKEVDKCKLLCSRCHDEIHYDWWKEQKLQTKIKYKSIIMD